MVKSNSDFGIIVKEKKKKAKLRKSQGLSRDQEVKTEVKTEVPISPIVEAAKPAAKPKKVTKPAVSSITLPEEPKPIILTQSAQVRIAEEKDKQTSFVDFGTSWFEN